MFSPLPSPLAEDGDYWRLINPGTHILTATAKGYSRVTKRIHLPYSMTRAGRVDFVLEQVWIFCHAHFFLISLPRHACNQFTTAAL